MAYQLVVWEGPRPADDAEGVRVCAEMVRAYDAGGRTEPTEAIRQFAAAVGEWAQTAKGREWAERSLTYDSLVRGSSGPMATLSLGMRRSTLVSCLVASIAEEHGLVCFDPQVGLLRPVHDEWSVAAMHRFTQAQARPQQSVR